MDKQKLKSAMKKMLAMREKQIIVEAEIIRERRAIGKFNKNRIAARKHPLKGVNEKGSKTTLAGSFVWAETPEGHEFWLSIVDAAARKINES